MKAFVCSKLDVKKIKKILLKQGFVVSRIKPDFIICYGGDGSTLFCERRYPGIPKLVVKTSAISHKYEIKEEKLPEALKKIKEKKYKVIEESKVEAIYRGKKLIGLNEVQVHHKLPTKAIRFSITVDSKKIDKIVADGVVVATPFGSTGYYKSITGKKFKKGLGIAFNNVHNMKLKKINVSGEFPIKIKIEKNLAILASDNNPKMFNLKPGDEVTIKLSDKKARFIQV